MRELDIKMKDILHRIQKRLKYEVGMIIGKNEIITSDKKGKKLLMIVHCEQNGIITILQTVVQYCSLSKFSIDILNVEAGFGSFSKTFLSKYEAIIVHNTANYTIRRMRQINQNILSKFNGIKVVMKQDEHYMTKLFVDFLDDNKIDLLLTIWDIDTAIRVYKQNQKNKRMHFMHFMTGYVPDAYMKFDFDLQHRDIDVGYRGSIQPLLFGRLAYEKREIGDRFTSKLSNMGLKWDISSRWEDRFMGDDWLNFLKRCKAVLGVESGSDIVDYTGEVKNQYYRFRLLHPWAAEEEVLAFVEQFKGEITYRAISPRHLEAAACGALQILYEGEYQGILKPYIHYVPLKRDYSNFEEVIGYIKDDVKRKEIVTRAREDLILSGKYSFQKFAEELDAKIEALMEERGGI